MEKINKFNIRVYGLVIEDQELLVLNEIYIGQLLNKLPGGGLEFGESVLDCLRRELQEELNLELKSAEHFYTQEEFLISKFRTNEQLLTIYYKAIIKDKRTLQIMEPSIKEVRWIPLSQLCGDDFTLPIDKKVISQLITNHKSD